MRASDLAYEAIIKKLLSGEFQCGDPIDEKEMLNVLKTSKTPLREAVVRLTQEGFIVNQSKRGLNFVSLSISDIHSLLDMRVTLMPHLANRLISNITDEQIVLLEKTITIDSIDVYSSDLSMHKLMNSFSKDRYLIETLDKLEKMSIISLRTLISFQKSKVSHESIFEDNMKIVEILKERDLDKLTDALVNHIPQYIIQYRY